MADPGSRKGGGDRRKRKGSSGGASGGGRAGSRAGGSSHRRSGGGAGRSAGPGGKGGSTKARRRDLEGAAANLPNWIVEALARVTPAKRVPGALKALGEASEALADGAYQRAVRKAETAKELAPRDTTVREVLGLAAYRSGNWQKALSELRAFRRMAGETTHLPIEMDVLRALGRGSDVESAWQTLIDRGGKPAVMKEGAVVYASHLIDEGDLDRAWAVVRPGRRDARPFPEDLRMWYVAARVAALRGDADTAGDLRNAILGHDPAFPGIDELEALIART
jgi:hypothetical protein